MINDDVSRMYRRANHFAGVIFPDATLREPEAGNLALPCVHSPSPPPSPDRKCKRWPPTTLRRAREILTLTNCGGLELINLDYHPGRTAVADARDEKSRRGITDVRGGRGGRAESCRSIYCVFSKVRSKADGKLRTRRNRRI